MCNAYLIVSLVALINFYARDTFYLQKKITMETIQTYVRLDNEIHMMEIKNIRKSLKMKEDQLKDVQQTESQLKTHYKECQDKT